MSGSSRTEDFINFLLGNNTAVHRYVLFREAVKTAPRRSAALAATNPKWTSAGVCSRSWCADLRDRIKV
jgi:hypothetical protein